MNREKTMSKSNVKLQQNAGEFYFTYMAQTTIDLYSSVVSKNSIALKNEFEDYIRINNVKSFDSSVYKSNIDNNINDIVSKWISKFGNNISISNCMKTGRAEQKKADMVLHTSNNDIGISLKVYKGDKIGDIQVNSGTWTTAILNMIFDSPALGSWSFDNKTFTSKGKKNLNTIHESINKWSDNLRIDSTPFINVIDNAIYRNNAIKERFVYSSDTDILTDAIRKEFSERCEIDGHAQIVDMMAALNVIPEEYIRRRFLKIVGFDADNGEELLCIWNKEYTDSITNNKFKILKNRLNSHGMNIIVKKHMKNIRLEAIDTAGEILIVDIPFTINKNGAWHDEPVARWCSKSKSEIQAYHRRPGKAKEMNTSTNTWIRLKSAIA